VRKFRTTRNCGSKYEYVPTIRLADLAGLTRSILRINEEPKHPAQWLGCAPKKLIAHREG
jgi:hypothetical protein